MCTFKKLLVVALLPLLSSCALEEQPVTKDISLDLPETPYKYNNSTNDNIATLGRVLFYDRQLSLNNSVSCSSCHKQSMAFADNVAFSKGFEGKRTLRNSMPIQNLGITFPGGDSIIIDPMPGFFNTVLFWDGRETQLREMVMKPIVNHIEMGIRDVNDLPQKLASVPYYEDLFTKAYGDPAITADRIADALSQFLFAITSNNTEFDGSLLGVAQLDPVERLGSELFITTYDCNSCHQIQNSHGYLFEGGVFANIGLEMDYQDHGVSAVTGYTADDGKFKIPSLRNVVLTAPYMHDGRFETLDDVLEHYSEGIQDHPNLDIRLRDNTGKPLAMEIPQADRDAIIAFLNTLTDYEMLTDVRFSDPFKTK